MTWLDALLVIFVMAVAALTSGRRWTGVTFAAAGLLLVGPLLRLGLDSAWLALLVAVAAVFILAILTTRLLGAPAANRGKAGVIAGSLLGLVFGAVLLLSMMVSLPLGRNSAGQIVYPQFEEMPVVLHEALIGSPLVSYGRTVLLQPLLAAQVNPPAASEWEVTVWLHDWLVPGEPWN